MLWNNYKSLIISKLQSEKKGVFKVEYACKNPVFCYNIAKQEREGFNQLKTSQKLSKGEQPIKTIKTTN